MCVLCIYIRIIIITVPCSVRVSILKIESTKERNGIFTHDEEQYTKEVSYEDTIFACTNRGNVVW